MPLIPAATVIVLRERNCIPETLLLHRNPNLSVQGGTWVFPGGHVDPTDGSQDGSLDAARRCAVREAYEEAGLRLHPEDLVPVSKWITPRVLPKRFEAWFFIASMDGDADITIDDCEIVDHCWQSAQEAIDAHNAGQRVLTPPGFVLLSQIAALGSLEKILNEFASAPPIQYVPRLVALPDGACSVYQDDAAYDGGDLELPGPRHRLWMRSSGWMYECGRKRHPA